MITMFPLLSKLWRAGNSHDLPNLSMPEIKEYCNILFIDDESFKVVNNLRKSGWKNTVRVKDIDRLDQNELVDAHIVFSDIQGVGLKLLFNDEGVGLIRAIRKRFPMKYIIAYSSESKGKISAFEHSDLYQNSDLRLRKNADLTEFTTATENFSKQIFTLDGIVSQIQSELLEKHGYTTAPDYEEVVALIRKVASKRNFSEGSVSRVFNLANAAHITQILQLYLSIRS